MEFGKLTLNFFVLICVLTTGLLISNDFLWNGTKTVVERAIWLYSTINKPNQQQPMAKVAKNLVHSYYSSPKMNFASKKQTEQSYSDGFEDLEYENQSSDAKYDAMDDKTNNESVLPEDNDVLVTNSDDDTESSESYSSQQNFNQHPYNDQVYPDFQEPPPSYFELFSKENLNEKDDTLPSYFELSSANQLEEMDEPPGTSANQLEETQKNTKSKKDKLWHIKKLSHSKYKIPEQDEHDYGSDFGSRVNVDEEIETKPKRNYLSWFKRKFKIK